MAVVPTVSGIDDSIPSPFFTAHQGTPFFSHEERTDSRAREEWRQRRVWDASEWPPAPVCVASHRSTSSLHPWHLYCTVHTVHTPQRVVCGGELWARLPNRETDRSSQGHIYILAHRVFKQVNIYVPCYVTSQSAKTFYIHV